MRPLACLLLPAALVAQQPQPLEVQRFLRDLRKGSPGTLVFLEDPAGAWKKTVVELTEDEAFAERDLELVWWGVNPDLKSEAPIAAYLARRYGWEKGSHWAFVDAKGEILFQGESIPTVQALRDGLDQAGIQGPIQVLKAFLQKNPDHLEARALLMEKSLFLADRRTARLYPEKRRPRPEPGEEAPGPAAEVPLLDEKLDARIWGGCSSQLERFLVSENWAASHRISWVFLLGQGARHSSMMRAVAAKCLPLVEAELRHQPSEWQTWQVWLKLANLAGGRPLRPLLDSLLPAPAEDRESWPPTAVLDAYVKEARARGDWRAIQEVLWPRWEELRLEERNVKFLRVEEGKPPVNDQARWQWESLLAPLLEALLRGGSTGEADSLVTEAAARLGPGEVLVPAQQVAIRCKQPLLAARWKALVADRS